jgi:RND superfamily putative drug exporter
MFEALARLVTSYPRRIVGLWLALAVLALPFSLRAPGTMTADTGGVENSRAAFVRDLVEENFAGQDAYNLLLVIDGGSSLGVGDPGFETAYERIYSRLTASGLVAGILDYRQPGALTLQSGDGRYAVAVLGLSAKSDELAKEAVGLIRAINKEVLEGTPGATPAVYVTGVSAVVKDMEDLTESDTRRAEVIGLPLSLIILLIAFGAAVAASIPILVGVLAITLTMAVLFVVGQFVTVSIFATSVVTMLGLATGIDYALLMVGRFREELKGHGTNSTKGPSAQEAAIITTQTAGRAVAFSGLTVMIALCALLIPPLPFIQSLGAGGIIVLFFSMSLSVTLVPALLTLLGERVNRLKVVRGEPGARSRAFWRRWGEFVLRRPLLFAGAATLALLLLTAPALRMELGFTGARGLSTRAESRLALDGLTAVGLIGALQTFDVLIDFGDPEEGARGVYHPLSLRSITALSRAAAELDNVREVVSATTAPVPGVLLRGYFATQETALKSPLAELARATVSENGRYALVRVYPSGETNPSEGQRLANDLEALVRAQGLGAVSQIGGEYQGQLEWTEALYGRFPLAVALIFAATFILLGVAFKSLVIPLKSILLNTLTVGAAYGLLTLVFQEGFLIRLTGLPGGLGMVESTTPILVFAVIFGLSMDYEVFLVSRIYEGHRRGMTDREAVVYALATTGGVITSAALIMGVVFSVFIWAGVTSMQTVGFGLAVAVILDATLVRMMLVPTVMVLAGRLNWWLPGPLRRALKGLSITHD